MAILEIVNSLQHISKMQLSTSVLGFSNLKFTYCS